MKNSQKGFVVPLLIAIVALLVIGGGVYIYENKKAEIPIVVDNLTQQVNQVQQTNTQNAPVTTTTNNKPGPNQISVVSPKVTSISPNVLPDGSTNIFYSQGLTAVGFPTNDLTWKVVSGSLPTGFYLQKAILVCNTSIPADCPDQSVIMFKASISGLPTQEGTYPFSVKVDDGNQSATKSYTITIKPGFAIKTDKSTYSSNDPIVMTMIAYNQTEVTKVFTFQDTCQTSYRINNLNGRNFFDSINNPSCPSTPTSVTVPAFGTYTWTVTHNPSTYKLPPGTYKIQGWIMGQARFDSAPITITN